MRAATQRSFIQFKSKPKRKTNKKKIKIQINNILVCKCIETRIMGNKWFSTDTFLNFVPSTTILRPNRRWNYFEFIVISILLYLLTIENCAVADNVWTTTWSPIKSKTIPFIDQTNTHENSSIEHINLRDITENVNGSGEYAINSFSF